MGREDIDWRILGSRAKILIIKYLSEAFEANITRIVKSTGLHYRTVESNLEELKRMGVVEEHRYGRLRVFSLNYSDPKVRILIDAINALED